MVTLRAAMSALRDLCAEPYGVWLDSSMAGGTLGTRSFWAAEPVAVLRSWGRQVQVERRSATQRFEGDPFEVLRELLGEHARYREGRPSVPGYGLKRHVEQLPDTVTDDLGLPECHLAFYERLHEIEPGPLAPAEPPALGREFPGMRSTFSRAEYEAAVRRALEYIRAGDIYQVTLSQRFEAACSEDPFAVYMRLRALSPAPFAAFLRLPDCAVLSSSPERLLSYTPGDRRIETRPIKGTRPRGATPEEDEALRRELLASEKDRAENVMIVDLERNDLGRVAQIGSVRVAGLFEAETYATVHHLVSTIEARLAEGRDAVDLLRATFPGGSITGA
jgi:para-aminobenzoate synthetase component 1